MEKNEDDYLSEDLLQVVLYESESEEDEDYEIIDILEVPDSESDSDEDELFEMNLIKEENTGRNHSDHFMSRNGKIKWFKDPVKKEGHEYKSSDVDCVEFGIQECAKHLGTPLETFSLFFDNQVIDLIVSYTNIYIRRLGKRYERARDCKETSRDEMTALIGLLLFSGVLKTPHFHFKDMWAQDGTGMDLFRLTMSFGRFRFLLRCLRFDNFELRRSTMKKDRLTPVRELLKLVQQNFRKAFIPGRNVTVYEHVIPFRGKCNFKMFSRRKPKKYGINLLSIADTETFYFMSCEIITEKRRKHHLSRQTPVDIVGRLVEDIKGSHRDVIGDECCTTVSLALALKNQGLSFVGTCSKRDKDIPREFHSIGRPVKSSLYGFTDELALVSYVPKRKHTQVLLTSRTQDRSIDGNCSKPDVVSATEFSDLNLDEFRQFIDGNNVGSKTKRWPLLIFFHLLNMASRNAQIIHSDSSALTRSEFVKKLSLSLIKNRMELRSECGRIPKELRKRIRLSVDASLYPPAGEGPCRGRCHICSRKKDIKSRQRCCSCNNFICKEHSKVTCNDCLGNIMSPSAASYYEDCTENF